MYDKLIENLGKCFSESMHLLLHSNMEPGSLLVSSLLSFTQKSDKLYFLTDFQNKNFVREWCDQNKELAGEFVEMASTLARDLDAFSSQTKDRPFCTSDEMSEKLVRCGYVVGIIISYIKE